MEIKIIPLTGVFDICFGMTPENVSNIFDSPIDAFVNSDQFLVNRYEVGGKVVTVSFDNKGQNSVVEISFDVDKNDCLKINDALFWINSDNFIKEICRYDGRPLFYQALEEIELTKLGISLENFINNEDDEYQRSLVLSHPNVYSDMRHHTDIIEFYID